MNQKNIFLDNCINYLKTEEFKKQLKDTLAPILGYIFGEISIYIYLIIFFILFSFFLHLFTLFILIRYIKNSKVI